MRGVFKNPEERARKISESKKKSLKSKKASKKNAEKMGRKNKGKKFTQEHKEKLSGRIPWNKGLTKETSVKVKKITEAISGEKSNLWKGGISKELYGFEWTNLLKHSIRTRDCFICQICKKNGWVVHHIDYNKKNNNPNNLITLCNKCHGKTNGKRNYWVKFFKNLCLKK